MLSTLSHLSTSPTALLYVIGIPILSVLIGAGVGAAIFKGVFGGPKPN